MPAIVVRSASYVVGGQESTAAPTGVDLRYRYTINGKTYEVSGFGSGAAPPGDTREWVKSHPQGGLLQVYVDPSDPQLSAVNPGPPLSALLCMLVALPFSLIGLSGLLSEQAQSRLSFEGIAVAWGALAFALYAAAHTVTLGVGIALAVYFGFVGFLHWVASKAPVSTLEENPSAPTQFQD